MAERSDFGTEAGESEGEFYQLNSDDSSEDEYCVISFSEERRPDPALQKKWVVTDSGISSEVEPDVQTENSCNVSDSIRASFQDAYYYSSEESSSLKEQAIVIESKGEYEVVEEDDDIADEDVDRVMEKFKVKRYSAGRSNVDWMVSKCRKLYDRDYIFESINNANRVLCKHYPASLIVPVAEKLSSDSTDRSQGVEFNPNIYVADVERSSASRIRKRFVAPVIMFNKKFICRSATITVRKTAAYETAIQSSGPQAENVDDGSLKRAARYVVGAAASASSYVIQAATQFVWADSMTKLRDIDAKIIRDLSVQYICDLMFENRKKFVHVRLSSSEKINKHIYRDCNIEQMPYPGCEFFKVYYNENRNPEGLIFDWDRPDCDTTLKFSEDLSGNFPDIEWENYKEWDLVELTKNYMKVLLLYLAKGKGGLLVHCVSGWDRTPLFISMLRVSLWADGVIHKSLNHTEMAYLTLAYDWYLFGHNLPARLAKREEIMHFCFKFLQCIVDDEFSFTRIFHQLPDEQREGGTIPAFRPGIRISPINQFCTYILNVYDKSISCMF